MRSNQTPATPLHRHYVAVMVSVWLTSACTLEGLPLAVPETMPELGAAIGTPTPVVDGIVEPAEENVSTDPDETTDENEPTDTDIPVDENTPPEEIEPADESHQTDPPIEEETVNLAPDILDTSYTCDPILETVLFTVGETDNFTLSIEDEFPLEIVFQADSSTPDVMEATVDENGIFTVVALQPGESYLWLSVSDHEGLVDEYELHVIVE